MTNLFLKISLILLAITLVYVAGFSMMHGGGHEECVAANIAGGQCVGGSNFFETASIHLDALKRISTTTPASFSAGISVIFLILLSVLFAILSKDKEKRAVLHSARVRLFARVSSLKKKLDWLTTREKRDPSFRFAVGA